MFFSKFRIVFFALFLVFAITAPHDGRADTVELKNGDRLSGKVESLSEGKLVVSTPHAGKVTLDWKSVKALETERELPVHLASGEMILGRLKKAGDGRVRIVSKAVGASKEIDVKNIVAINKPADRYAKWGGEVFFGLTSTSGNTNGTQVNSTFSATRETFDHKKVKDRLNFHGYYNLVISEVEDASGEKENEIAARNAGGGFRYDYFFIPDRAAWFVLADISYDRFRDLDLCAEEALGVAYTFIKSKKQVLAADIGVAQIDEFHSDSEDESDQALRAGFNYKWNIIKMLAFTQAANVKMKSENMSEDYLVRSETSLNSQLTNRWVAKASFILDYDNLPPEGVNKSDRMFILQLGYKF